MRLKETFQEILNKIDWVKYLEGTDWLEEDPKLPTKLSKVQNWDSWEEGDGFSKLDLDMHPWSGHGEIYVNKNEMGEEEFERISYYPLEEVLDQDNFDIQLYIKNGTTLLAWEIHED